MGLFTEDAVKERLKARVAIDGPTGSGKTWTALQWATILATQPDGTVAPIGVIDTENRSAAYYAPTPGKDVKRLQRWDPPYEFKHLKAMAPYDPRVLGRQMDAAEDDLGEDGVLIIDSLTHYWFGEGGTRDIVDDAAQRAGGNTFVGWSEGTPAQRYMLDKIVHAPYHVIVTMRSKMEYVLEQQTRGGKSISVPKKVGMAPEQRPGIEYEFTLVVDMDLEHRLVVGKSRCDEVADMVAPKGRSADVAHKFAEWLGSGVTRISVEQAAEISDRFATITDARQRREVKDQFVATFGVPAELLSDKLAEATAWIDTALADVVPQDQLDTPEPADEPVPTQGALADALADQ